MRLIDVIVSACVVVALVLAVYLGRRRKKTGGCCGDCSKCAKAGAVGDKMRSHYPYEAEAEITGMTCQNCAVKVENALNALDGVWAVVRVDTKRARILCRDPPSEERIRRAVHGAGYGVAGFRTHNGPSDKSPRRS